MAKAKTGKIDWCLKSKNGIKIIEPNDALSQEYIKEATETLSSMLSTKGKWKTIMAYYACYNALYSVLIKAGIKSEIHDCTIALMGMISGFDSKDIDFLSSLKTSRIDAQYYLKDVEFKDEAKAKEFVAKCKQLLLSDLAYIAENLKERQN